MRCALKFGLLVLVASVVCGQNRPEVDKSRPVGVIYLIQLLKNQSPNTKNDLETTNFIPNDYPYTISEKESSKFLLALAQSSVPKENREKRSPTKKGGYGGHHYGGGGGGCNVCGGGGHGGGYYPSGGGGSFSQSHASASASSFSSSGGYYG